MKSTEWYQDSELRGDAHTLDTEATTLSDPFDEPLPDPNAILMNMSPPLDTLRR